MIKHGHAAIAHSAVLRPQWSDNLRKLEHSDPFSTRPCRAKGEPQGPCTQGRHEESKHDIGRASHASSADLAGDAQLAPVACSKGRGVQCLQPVILQAGLALLPLHAQP